ncbi:uncharacterized protein LOC109846596 [Asparagus officinalis]|uniref:uncharacterized protein LOC109846596 n=1 Tax=Asparagus officinalis TaxID=4686 RepID=UPI00098E698C|nr:uncharacterized protein LOC109846596 [Asparagus officinalis]
MDWPLVKDQDGVALRTLTFHGVRTVGYNRQVTALRSSLFAKEYPLGEVPSPAKTFVKRFLEKKGEFPAQGFRTPGWVHSPAAGWWAQMTKFVLKELETPLAQAGLLVPEEEQPAEPAPGEEQRVVDPPTTRAAGKRKLYADEAGKYDKQIRRKLLVDSPPKGQQKSKLMAEAIRAAVDEEQQESSMAGLPHRAGLRSHGPALSDEASSYHPPEDQEDELLDADAESAPVMDLPRSPVLEPGGLEENPSPSPSALVSQAGDMVPSPTTGPMRRPTDGASLEPSAAQDDEERVDYDDSPTDDAADEDRGDEDADAGNMSGGGEDDDEHDSIDDVTTFDDDAPKVPSDKVSGYTPFHISGKSSFFRLLPLVFSAFRPFFRAGSPTPGTTSAAPLEQEPAQVLALPQEPHLSGSPTVTVPPVALPETTAATPPPEQQLVQVSAPMQEQPLPDSSVVATSSKAVMKISLTPTEAGPSSSQVKAWMALTTSPSQLNISIASAASAPGSPASHHLNASISAAEEVSSGAIVSLANAPKFLQISLVYLNSLAKTVVESLMNGQGTLNSFRPLLEAGLNGVRSVGETQWFEHCS